MKARALPSLVSLRLHAAEAGFTLVELMVAMSGGLFLSIVVFALARDNMRFYQQETRAANATLAGVTGFERLSNDIARAGHLASPNVGSDPRVCNRPDGGWPALLQNMRAIVIETDDTYLAGTEVAVAGIHPQGIIIAGALEVTEELQISHLGLDGTGNVVVTIRENSPAASRVGIVPGATDDNKAILDAIFMPGGTGRAVRLTQLDGLEQYGVVSGVVATPSIQITLGSSPAISFRTSAVGSLQCGFMGFTTGATINVVNFIHYQLAKMSGDANYKPLFDASKASGLAYESGRVELVREELSPFGGGAVIAGTRELIAEYAVDLQFSVWQASSPGVRTLLSPSPLPALITNTYASTQLLRGVHARLSVRSREADRNGPSDGVGGGMTNFHRIPIDDAGTARWARVRTLQSDVQLRNLEGANW